MCLLDLLAQVYSAERLHVSLKNLSVPRFAYGFRYHPMRSHSMVEVKTWMIEVRFDQGQPGESHPEFGFLLVTHTKPYNSTSKFAIIMMLLILSRIRFLFVQVTSQLCSIRVILTLSFSRLLQTWIFIEILLKCD